FSELHLQHINPSTSPNELNTTLTPHSMIHGDACFAYFNKIWGIPSSHIQRRYTGVTDSSRKSIIRPPTLAYRLRSDRHLADRVDRRPYAEVGNTLLKELDRLGSEGSCSLG